MRASTANSLANLCVAVGVLAVVGCADDRVPLEDCDHGLYWAECGGNGEAVLGCDRDTGNCRWFAGGLTARGHAVSTCPTTNPCCHSGWPFTDFSPDGTVREVAVEQMSLLRGGVIQRRSSHNEVVVQFDFAEEPGGASEFCGLLGCATQGLGLPVVVGSSIVFLYDGAVQRWELEIVPGVRAEDWSVQLYQFVDNTREGLTPPLICGDWYSYSAPFVLEGVLHLSTDDLSVPDAVHGHLEASGGPYNFDVWF